MKVFIILSFLTSFILAITTAVNYCDGKWECKIDNVKQKHIRCIANQQFSKTVTNPRKFTISTTLQNKIVDLHNELRNKIAGGLQTDSSVLKGVKAGRMMTLRWHNELAATADLNTRKCVLKHDCHGIPNFEYAGQNIYIAGTSLPMTEATAEEMILAGIKDWYAEYKNLVSIDQIRSYPSGLIKNVIGHFTALVKESNPLIGCGATIFKEGSFNKTILTCNYGKTNMVGRPILIPVNAAGANCTKRNPTHPYLCDLSEIIDQSP